MALGKPWRRPLERLTMLEWVMRVGPRAWGHSSIYLFIWHYIYNNTLIMLGSNSFRNIYITFFVFILGCEFLFFSCRSFWFTASHYVGSEATSGSYVPLHYSRGRKPILWWEWVNSLGFQHITYICHSALTDFTVHRRSSHFFFIVSHIYITCIFLYTRNYIVSVLCRGLPGYNLV